jgi:hypothetical protein
MTPQTAKPSFINNPARCTHRFANGVRCRLLTLDADASYCTNHARLVENQLESADTAASLTADLKEFRSAIPINAFLARLLLLLAENKISPVAPPSSPISPTNSSALFPRSTASSIPRKIPTLRPRSSSTCPAPNATACRRQSPPTPMCAPDGGTAS